MRMIEQYRIKNGIPISLKNSILCQMNVNPILFDPAGVLIVNSSRTKLDPNHCLCGTQLQQSDLDKSFYQDHSCPSLFVGRKGNPNI